MFTLRHRTNVLTILLFPPVLVREMGSLIEAGGGDQDVIKILGLCTPEGLNVLRKILSITFAINPVHVELFCLKMDQAPPQLACVTHRRRSCLVSLIVSNFVLHLLITPPRNVKMHTFIYKVSLA